MAQRYCLFAYFDPLPVIRPEIHHYLSELVSCGYEVHVAFSGHPYADGRAVESALGLPNVKIWPRKNGGLDFGAWQYLLRQVALPKSAEVLLANDSVFGPLHPLAPYLDTLRHRNADVWGMVGSNEVRPHLQSWFLGFSEGTFFRPAVQRIFDLPFDTMSKSEIIFHGEIGLGVAVQEDGCTITAMWMPSGYVGRFLPGNAMHHAWHTLVAQRFVPFIKSEALRDNPLSLRDIASWRVLLRDNRFFNTEWIEQYLDRHPKRGAALPNAWRHRLLQIIYKFILRRPTKHFHIGIQ